MNLVTFPGQNSRYCQKSSLKCLLRFSMKEDFKVSERPIEQVKGILTDASRYGKRGKYTLKDINVEQETAQVTNGHEQNWPAWGTAIIVVFGVLLLAAILTIYVVRII